MEFTQRFSSYCGFQCSLKNSFLWLSTIVVFFLSTNLFAQVVRNELQVSTNTSSKAERLFTGILLDLEANDLERFSEELDKLRTEFSGVMVPVGSHHQIEASLLADLLIRHPQALAPTLSESSVSGETPGYELWRMLMSGRLSPEKLISMGNQHLKSGEISSAERCWRIARSESLDFLPVEHQLPENLLVEISKREILSTMLTGRLRESTTKLQGLQSFAPEATGRLIGKQGILVEILQQQLRSLRHSLREAFVMRNELMPFDSVRFTFVEREWSAGIATNSDHRSSIRAVLWKDVLFLQDANGLRALNQKTGQSAWPVDENDQGFLFETKPTDSEESVSPMAITNGTLHNETLFVRTGHSGPAKKSTFTPAEKSRISAFNLSAEGRLEWTVSADSLSGTETENEFLFTGTPVVVADKLVVPVRSLSASAQLKVVCLDQSNGAVQWVQNVAASLRVPESKEISFDDHLVRSEGCLLWLIDGETLCCLNEQTGQVQWLSGIDSTSKPAPSSPSNGKNCIAFDGIVYCATQNGVAAFDLYSGSLIWEQFLDTPPKYVLGNNDGLVLLSTPGLIALDRFSGRLEWKHTEPQLPFHSNRGELIGRTIFWPRTTEIWTVDAQTGQLLQRDQYQRLTGKPAHGLQLSGSRLYVNEGDQFTAYKVKPHTSFQLFKGR